MQPSDTADTELPQLSASPNTQPNAPPSGSQLAYLSAHAFALKRSSLSPSVHFDSLARHCSTEAVLMLTVEPPSGELHGAAFAANDAWKPSSESHTDGFGAGGGEQARATTRTAHEHGTTSFRMRTSARDGAV